MQKILIKYFPWQIILMTLNPVVKAYALGKIPQAYDYIVYIMIAVTALWFYIANYKVINKEYHYLSFAYKVLIAYVLVGFIKNIFVPSGLYPFFKLNVCTAFLAFGSIFIFIYEQTIIRKVIQLWWKVVPIVFCLTFWKVEKSQYIIMMQFCLLFLIFLPFFSKIRKIAIIGLLVFVAYNGMQQRIDFLSYLLPILLYVVVKQCLKFDRKFFKASFHTLMLLPVFFLSLFLYSGFNVLNMDSYVHDDIESSSAGRMTDDTRSFLFEEAYISAVSNNYLLLGRTPYYGYDSYWVTQREGEGLEVRGVAQRASEVFIVNMLTWTGLFGCFMFFLLYYVIGIDTLSKTKNNLLSVLCLYIAIFWIISWISHNMFTPSLDYMILYIVIALCLNPIYREMSNRQMKNTLKRILQ